MMDFLLLVVPIAILLILSSGVNKLFGYKIEQSHFLIVCAISLWLIGFGLVGLLEIGFYIIVCFSILMLVYLIVRKFDFKTIFTPAICGYLVGLALYAFFVRKITLYNHDEYSHWAYATKMMIASGRFFKGLQTMFAPTFNYFITKTSSYTIGNLYSGSWIIMFSCFMLPLGGITWDRWKSVSIYYIAQYCLLGVLYAIPTFHNDELLGFITAAICAFSALNRNKKAIDYILIMIGLLAITQVKDSTGAVYSFFAALFVITTDVVINIDDVKKILVRCLAILSVPVLGYFISGMTLNKPDDYFSLDIINKFDVFEIFSNSITFIGLCSMLALLFILYILFLCNKKKINFHKKTYDIYKIIGLMMLPVLFFLIYKSVFLYLDNLPYHDMLSLIKSGWQSYFYHSSGGMTNKLFYAYISIIVVAAGVLVIKKPYRREYALQIIILFSFMITTVVLVLLSYSLGYFQPFSYTKSDSWERYIQPPIITMLSYLLAYFMLGKNIYIDEKKYRPIMMVALLLLTVRHMPYLGINMLSVKDSVRMSAVTYEKSFADDEQIIKDNLSDDSTLYIVSYPNNNPVEPHDSVIWLKYCIAPIEGNWPYLKHLYSDDMSHMSKEQHYNDISRYDYLYVASAGHSYYEAFGDIYSSSQQYSKKALYKVISSDSQLILEPVDLDEAILLE